MIVHLLYSQVTLVCKLLAAVKKLTEFYAGLQLVFIVYFLIVRRYRKSFSRIVSTNKRYNLLTVDTEFNAAGNCLSDCKSSGQSLDKIIDPTGFYWADDKCMSSSLLYNYTCITTCTCNHRRPRLLQFTHYNRLLLPQPNSRNAYYWRNLENRIKPIHICCIIHLKHVYRLITIKNCKKIENRL
jgi:hypothetical protein